MSKPKKKFKDTKVGQFLIKKVPSILGIVGDVLPDAGVLGLRWWSASVWFMKKIVCF